MWLTRKVWEMQHSASVVSNTSSRSCLNQINCCPSIYFNVSQGWKGKKITFLQPCDYSTCSWTFDPHYHLCVCVCTHLHTDQRCTAELRGLQRLQSSPSWMLTDASWIHIINMNVIHLTAALLKYLHCTLCEQSCCLTLGFDIKRKQCNLSHKTALLSGCSLWSIQGPSVNNYGKHFRCIQKLEGEKKAAKIYLKLSRCKTCTKAIKLLCWERRQSKDQKDLVWLHQRYRKRCLPNPVAGYPTARPERSPQKDAEIELERSPAAVGIRGSGGRRWRELPQVFLETRGGNKLLYSPRIPKLAGRGHRKNAAVSTTLHCGGEKRAAVLRGALFILMEVSYNAGEPQQQCLNLRKLQVYCGRTE